MPRNPIGPSYSIDIPDEWANRSTYMFAAPSDPDLARGPSLRQHGGSPANVVITTWAFPDETNPEVFLRREVEEICKQRAGKIRKVTSLQEPGLTGGVAELTLTEKEPVVQLRIDCWLESEIMSFVATARSSQYDMFEPSFWQMFRSIQF